MLCLVAAYRRLAMEQQMPLAGGGRMSLRGKNVTAGIMIIMSAS
jgi:hypothetical protein